MNYKVLEALDVETPHFSAQELARAVGATKAQILYWGKKKYITRRDNGYHMFPVEVIPKAKVMTILVSEVGLEPEKASRLAQRLLDRFEDAPDATRAVIGFLKALSEHLDEVIALIAKREYFQEAVDSLGCETARPAWQGKPS